MDLIQLEKFTQTETWKGLGLLVYNIISHCQLMTSDDFPELLRNMQRVANDKGADRCRALLESLRPYIETITAEATGILLSMGQTT